VTQATPELLDMAVQIPSSSWGAGGRRQQALLRRTDRPCTRHTFDLVVPMASRPDADRRYRAIPPSSSRPSGQVTPPPPCHACGRQPVLHELVQRARRAARPVVFQFIPLHHGPRPDRCPDP
jgi:hypothetical protein